MRWSPPEQKAQTPSVGDGPLPVSSTQPTSDAAAGVVERGDELVDGPGPEGVAHLGPVERDADRPVLHGAVVRDVGEVEVRHLLPGGLVEQLGNHGPSLRDLGEAAIRRQAVIPLAALDPRTAPPVVRAPKTRLGR